MAQILDPLISALTPGTLVLLGIIGPIAYVAALSKGERAQNARAVLSILLRRGDPGGSPPKRPVAEVPSEAPPADENRGPHSQSSEQR